MSGVDLRDFHIQTDKMVKAIRCRGKLMEPPQMMAISAKGNMRNWRNIKYSRSHFVQQCNMDLHHLRLGKESPTKAVFPQEAKTSIAPAHSNITTCYRSCTAKQKHPHCVVIEDVHSVWSGWRVCNPVRKKVGSSISDTSHSQLHAV